MSTGFKHKWYRDNCIVLSVEFFDHEFKIRFVKAWFSPYPKLGVLDVMSNMAGGCAALNDDSFTSLHFGNSWSTMCLKKKHV